ncbi:MAG: LCP family protein [Patescibacteria group bacterium]|jgi:LCP family protein required for cell wall assembly
MQKTDPPEQSISTPSLTSLTRWQLIRQFFTWKKIALLLTLLLICGVTGIYVLLNHTAKQIIQTNQPVSLWQQIGQLFGNNNTPLQGEAEDRINVLLLGIAGSGHDGSQLTDTIIVASIKPSTKQIALLSLPRDLQVKYYNDKNPKWYEYHKINSAYAFGGIDLTEEKITDVTGLPIHYYIVLDFSGFKKIIDDIGGLDVTIERTFTGMYGTKDLATPCPTAQLRHLNDGEYCAITFQAGQQHLAGEAALMFARIRKSDPRANNNPLDMDDFGRSQRQQQVLESFRAHVLSANTLLRPDRVAAILNDLGDNLKTNLQIWEMGRLAQWTLSVPKEQITSKVIDDKTTNLVETVNEHSASYVVPRAGNGDFSEIQKLAANIFITPVETTNTNSIAATNTNVITESTEPAKVQILNGTNKTGLAAKTAETLRPLDIVIINVNNAPEPRPVSTTLIYDLTTGQRPAALTALTTATQLTVATTTQLADFKALNDPDQLINNTVDFIIVLGSDVINQPVTIQ